MRRTISSCVLGGLLLVAGLAAQSRPAPQIASITKEQLRADLFFLAADGMQGRLTDTPQNALAAEWVRSRFERLRLTPGGPAGSYFHTYQLMAASLDDGNATEIRTADGVTLQLRHGQDAYPHRFSASAEASGGVVFAGFGIVSPERQHDDYATAVAGKIALVLDREPGVDDPESVFDGLVSSEPGQPLRKALAAQAKGAIGLVIVEDVHNGSGVPANFAAQAANYWPTPAPRVERYTLMAWADKVHIPVVQISAAAAARLVAGTGTSLLDLARAAERKGGASPVPLPGVELRLKTSVARRAVPDMNVLATLEGSDPGLRQEYVIVSAHVDHDGADGPRVYNGADDDGSGTVALLEIAEAFALAAEAGQRPKRSVLFAAWNSEERGLLGAWAYTEFPTVPLANVVGVLNMDMVGRNEEVPVGGGARFRGLEVQTAESNDNATNILGTVRSPDLKAALDAANGGIGLTLRYRYDNNASNLMRRSDQWPFIQRGVPGVWVHTGLHPDYHTVYDRPEKINYVKMEKIARFVYQAAWDLANGATRPALLPPAAGGRAPRS
jgi:Zn-dependent M28 family amino/carboxypeptidase